MKVLLVLVDGMRPDSMKNIKYAQEFANSSSYTLEACTVMPSVTLPCHMSLFHSVDPSRHGTTTNTFAPQVRQINGLCDVLSAAGKSCAFFYNWGELRDLARPSSLAFSYFASGGKLGYSEANRLVTESAIDYLSQHETDFAFLYLGEVDEKGHRYGWMSDEYLKAVEDSWALIEKITATLPDDYTVIVTADHGGHERIHGTDLPEDTVIPLFVKGNGFERGKRFEKADIKDIAPTVTKLLTVSPDSDWEGKPLI